MWTSYNENNLLENIDILEVEKSFYNNIHIFGLQDRIIGIKQDSTNALINFIQNKKMFDFIYIDGSHLLLDCYSDLVLAWTILEKDGIIGIDDYLYKKDSILDSPFEAVNHFLKRYEGKYKLLHKGYRVFLQKL
jgi:predicted O-methyltransferase YrrM